MAETIMREQTNAPIRDSLCELEGSLDSMRIFCDVMNDQLNGHNFTSQDSSVRLNERMIVLVRSLMDEIESAVELHAAASIAAFRMTSALKEVAQ